MNGRRSHIEYDNESNDKNVSMYHTKILTEIDATLLRLWCRKIMKIWNNLCISINLPDPLNCFDKK